MESKHPQKLVIYGSLWTDKTFWNQILEFICTWSIMINHDHWSPWSSFWLYVAYNWYMFFLKIYQHVLSTFVHLTSLFIYLPFTSVLSFCETRQVCIQLWDLWSWFEAWDPQKRTTNHKIPAQLTRCRCGSLPPQKIGGWEKFTPPKWMVYLCLFHGKPPIKMDDLGGPTPIFGKTQVVPWKEVIF